MRLFKFFKVWALTGPLARISKQCLSGLPANFQSTALGALAPALKHMDTAVVWAVAMAVSGHGAIGAALWI